MPTMITTMWFVVILSKMAIHSSTRNILLDLTLIITWLGLAHRHNRPITLNIAIGAYTLFTGVTSLRLVSPGAVTDGVTLFVASKSDDFFLFSRCPQKWFLVVILQTTVITCIISVFPGIGVARGCSCCTGTPPGWGKTFRRNS